MHSDHMHTIVTPPCPRSGSQVHVHTSYHTHEHGGLYLDLDPAQENQDEMRQFELNRLINECLVQGIDDILAILLALSAKPEEVEVLLISLTFGNIEVRR